MKIIFNFYKERTQLLQKCRELTIWSFKTKITSLRHYKILIKINSMFNKLMNWDKRLMILLIRWTKMPKNWLNWWPTEMQEWLMCWLPLVFYWLLQFLVICMLLLKELSPKSCWSKNRKNWLNWKKSKNNFGMMTF